MQVKLQNYQHAGNGISLQLYPETDVEEELLRGLWMHGNLKTGHPCKAKGDTGFYVEWKQDKKEHS